MSASKAKVVTFSIGQFRCEVSIGSVVKGDAALVTCEWSPRVPDFDVDFNAAERLAYQAKLKAAICDPRRAG